MTARWRIALLLDHIPWTCWAQLVTWAQRDTSLREVGQDSMCRADAQRLGTTCYCGKITLDVTP